MREIKFRAWDTLDKKFVEHALVFCSDSIYVGEFKDFGRFFDKENIPHRFVLMQDTGHKDKNGEKIFTDDVVLFDVIPEYGHEEKNQIGRVTCEKMGTLKFGCWISDYCYNVLKIGTFHENPELLNEEKTL